MTRSPRRPRWPRWSRCREDCRPGDLLLRAARLGQDDPQLAAASQECFAAADSALGRLGAPAAIRDAVAAFADRYVLRGRCPADDRLDEARAAARYPHDRLPNIRRNPDACLEDSHDINARHPAAATRRPAAERRSCGR